MGKTTSTIGVPIKLLHEAQGHIVTVEINTGDTYRGKLIESEDAMNVQLKDVSLTARNGKVSHLDEIYIRGSNVVFFIIPDMLRYAPFTCGRHLRQAQEPQTDQETANSNAPMFRARGQRGRGVGLARGRATVQRARGGRRG
ncbi:small nuclear ribonucleoprotein SmD3 [Penicillium argentinense]|uniref:Small nuclear ribonucleoprotein Sm D3 n=1 Tax=Penicillium argentinense TaxID=1131581 RepID=A0A9W9K226_9EURO|nr:small nuclear ribonucleoprotein SmD3 [Penicillium argentinense]KAJ5090254.1 small nuclear ribonucleoprotein SmD3 [Penicillium argentinense]